MSLSHNSEPRQERANTYFVSDRSNQEERARVRVQDHFLTTGMGGVLSEQTQTSQLRRVLDVGCGTGGWLIELAKTQPQITELYGVDISSTMIEYAREQAEKAGVNERVHFDVMDALLILEFPENFFDLVNLRLGLSFVRTWEWPKILQEFQRVCKVGGIVRITESDAIWGNSPAFISIATIALETFYRAGYYFTPERDGVTSKLAALLAQHGLHEVQTRAHLITSRGDTPEGQLFAEDMSRGFQTSLPFFRKWTRLPDDYQGLCQQARSEMQQPGFVFTWTLLTAWGTCQNGTTPR